MTKILILSGPHPYQIAGTVAKDMLDGFRKKNNIKVKLIVKPWDRYQDEDIVSIESKFIHLFNFLIRKFKGVLRRLKLHQFKSLLQTTNRDYCVQDYDQTKNYYSTKLILKKAGFKPDAIFIIFEQNFLTAKNIYELKEATNAKIYWHLIDMGSFTGLCHYSWDCDKYERVCGCCPAIYSNDVNDISRKNIEDKIEYIGKTDLHVVIGSNWLMSKAIKSTVFNNKKFSNIYMSCNSDEFRPTNLKNGKKSKFGIPKDHFVIGFGATSLNDKRKGIHYILDAIKKLFLTYPSYKIFILYPGNKKIDFDFGYKSKFLGMLNRNELPEFFQCCDVYINASIQDVGPGMLLQALMCGIPVVSFNTCIANEFVIDNETGYLVEDISADGIVKGLLKMMDESEEKLELLKKNAVYRTSKILSIENQINSYIQLFQEDGLI